jgi:sucrose-6-phosphate hydrolase SacC (GH32 family)
MTSPASDNTPADSGSSSQRCAPEANLTPASSLAVTSLRARYHFTPPRGWLSDPQRPIYRDGVYHLYYLHGHDYDPPRWWRRAQTVDGVAFRDEGDAIPLGRNRRIMSGSAVVDVDDTAGFGPGAVVALVTEPTAQDVNRQEQYLWHSNDGGFTFTAHGDPVITNPERSDWFRDPKVEWDDSRKEWLVAICRQRSVSFFASPDLLNWTFRSAFSHVSDRIRGFECPDVFPITADDGTRLWVVGVSVQGGGSDAPGTYVYWTGTWDGHEFTPLETDPQWLDRGLDWYAAVTWRDADRPETHRFAIAWMNNWNYARRTAPTDFSDGYNGQLSIVRSVALSSTGKGRYSLVSQPVSALEGQDSSRLVLDDIVLDDVAHDGRRMLGYRGRAYRLDLDVHGQDATNVGISVGIDGARRTDIGVSKGELYVDRTASDQTDFTFAPWYTATAPIDPRSTSFHLTVFVDTQSVEVFTDDRTTAISCLVHFLPEDTGVALYAHGGAARFSNIVITDLAAVAATEEETGSGPRVSLRLPCRGATRAR